MVGKGRGFIYLQFAFSLPYDIVGSVSVCVFCSYVSINYVKRKEVLSLRQKRPRKKKIITISKSSNISLPNQQEVFDHFVLLFCNEF